MQFPLLLLFLALFGNSFGQVFEFPLCTVDSQFVLPGLYPSYDSLPCVEQGKCTSTSIQFVNLDSLIIDGFPFEVEDFTITEISNLPCGMKYTSESFIVGQPRPIPNQGRTCIWIGGVTDDSVGLYEINIEGNATIRTEFLLNPITRRINMSDYGYKLYLRVVSNGSTVCAAVDTSENTLTASCSNGLVSCVMHEFGTYCDTCNVASTIEEIHPVSRLTLSPNPATQTVSIMYHTLANQPHSWQLINLLGQVVDSGQVLADEGSQQQVIDVSSLPCGTYVYTIYDGQQLTAKRLVVAR